MTSPIDLRRLIKAAKHAEAVMTIVAPRSHTKEYIAALAELRAALGMRS